jgi:hypothetical protein
VPCYLTHRSDAGLMDSLHSHRSEFNRIVQISRAAPAFVIDMKRGTPPAAQPRGVTSELLSALRDAGVREIDGGGSADGAVTFICSYCGGVLGGNSKGYVYSEATMKPVVATLDGYRPRSSSKAYRELGDGWYLFYEAW